MKVRVIMMPLTIALIVSPAALGRDTTGGYTAFPSINVRLLSPNIALRGGPDLKVGRLTLRRAQRFVIYTIVVTNTGDGPLHNVKIFFNPTPEDGAVISSPKASEPCNKAVCWTQWTIAHFPSHQRRLYRVRATYPSRPASYYAKQQILARGMPKGYTGIYGVNSEVDVLLRIPAVAEAPPPSPPSPPPPPTPVP